MNTNQIMELSLELAGLEAVPADSAVYHPGEDIRRVLAGIDIGVPELLLAKDMAFDLALAHHPIGGSAVLEFHRVFERHVLQMMAVGVPERVARDAVEGMVAERRILASMKNYDHAPSVARLVDMPLMNIHTPLDEIGRRKMAEAVSSLPVDATVNDLEAHFYETFGEFRNAATRIEVRVGREENRVGCVTVSHAAGTNGGYSVAKAYFDHDVDTVIYIHCRPQDSKRLRATYGDSKNLIVTGHIASDALGINPFLDALRERGVEVEAISGIIPP